MRPGVKNTVLFILLNILASCHDAFGEIIWRYSSKEGDGTLFSTRHLIVLEHFGAHESVDWCYPNDCYLKNKSYSSTILHCPKPGLHPVGPNTSSSNNQSFRYIQVVNSPFYYEWYLAYNRQSNYESQEEFKLWAVDPKHVLESEHNRTASFPSQFSKELTQVFFQLGLKPFVTATTGYRFINWDAWTIYNQSFISTEGYWQFSVQSVLNHQTTLWIDGQSIALYDRFIRRSSVKLLKTKFPFSVNSQLVQVIVRGNYPEEPFIIQDPCASHVAVLISSKCIITQDNFGSYEEIKVPSTLLTSEAVAKSVVFSAENLLVLLESGRLLVFNGTTQTWGNSSGRPQKGFSGLSSQKKCFKGEQKKVMMGVVVGWTNESVSYISKNSGFSFNQLAFPILSITNASIEHVEIHCLFPVVTFLLNASSLEDQQKMLFLQYNLMEDVWEEQEVTLPAFKQGPPLSFSFIPPSMKCVIVWSQKSFAFGRLNETGRVFRVKRQDNLTDFILGDNETVVSVIAGGHGEFVVHLSNNRMFYGRAFVDDVVEVFTGENPSSRLTAMFDMLGSLLVITTDGETTRSRKLPLENEVLNALYPHTSCPYLKFTTNVSAELQFIDKGDEIKVWAQLIHPRTTPNNITVEISSVDVLRIVTEGRIEHYPGIITLNKTFAFMCELRNGTSPVKSSYKSTAVAVQLLPSVTELNCENYIQVLHINVGCPPTKSIVIRNCTAPDGEGPAPLPSQTQDQTGELACHLNAVMNEAFKLVVDLYEEGRFVEEVHADYIVWEETGRADFGYTATMSEVGCVSEAQTWRKMAENYSGDLSNAWSQSNYQSCFEPGESDRSFDASQPYEILNSTGFSQLVFKGSGSLQFQLRVVDAHLSFCELSARFSVDVAGTEGKNYLPQLVSVLVVTLSSTVLLYISYAYYTKKTLNRHQEDEKEQQRLQELKCLFSAFQQGSDDAGLSHRRSAGHNVRRFTGTAMLMSEALPEECFSEASAIVGSREPSNVSFRSRKSSHTSNR